MKMNNNNNDNNNCGLIFRLQLKQVLIDHNNWENNITTVEAVDRIIKIFDDHLNELVVEERMNHRSICSRTIRKIKENILFAVEKLDPNVELIAPEPTKKE